MSRWDIICRVIDAKKYNFLVIKIEIIMKCFFTDQIGKY